MKQIDVSNMKLDECISLMRILSKTNDNIGIKRYGDVILLKVDD